MPGSIGAASRDARDCWQYVTVHWCPEAAEGPPGACAQSSMRGARAPDAAPSMPLGSIASILVMPMCIFAAGSVASAGKD